MACVITFVAGFPKCWTAFVFSKMISASTAVISPYFRRILSYLLFFDVLTSVLLILLVEATHVLMLSDGLHLNVPRFMYYGSFL